MSSSATVKNEEKTQTFFLSRHYKVGYILNPLCILEKIGIHPALQGREIKNNGINPVAPPQEVIEK